MNRTKDGEANYLELDGHESGWSIIGDTTGQTRAELVKELMMLRQRTILDNLHILSWLKDQDRQFEIVNSALFPVCNLPIDHIIGKIALEAIPPADAERCQSWHTRYLCSMNVET